MEVYACGFNSHSQLSSSPKHDCLRRFTKIAEGKTIRIRCAVWCATVIEIDDTLLFQGFHESGVRQGLISGLPPSRIKSVFGDTSGILGALTVDGEIWKLVPAAATSFAFIKYLFPPDSFVRAQHLFIDDLAMAGNDQVCISTCWFPISIAEP